MDILSCTLAFLIPVQNSQVTIENYAYKLLFKETRLVPHCIIIPVNFRNFHPFYLKALFISLHFAWGNNVGCIFQPIHDWDQRKCYLEVSLWGPMTKTSTPAKKANICTACRPTLFTFTLVLRRFFNQKHLSESMTRSSTVCFVLHLDRCLSHLISSRSTVDWCWHKRISLFVLKASFFGFLLPKDFPSFIKVCIVYFFSRWLPQPWPLFRSL